MSGRPLLPIFVNLILGLCATFVGATGIGKWPLLFTWIGGLAIGVAIILALTPRRR
jgi:hypothetical protein